MNSREFEEKIAEYAKEQALFASGDKIAVALSGGADSVALLCVLLSMGCECYALHCNFHLRGEESNRDEKFVTDLCNRYDIPLYIKHFDVAEYERKYHVSTEMACRELRYAWFAGKMKEIGIELLAVAHHQDDNIETLFLNIIRGSGIHGLAGIKPRNGEIVRPLLCVSRKEIEAYLLELGQNYVVDSTNKENDYKRNKLRNVLLPMFYELFPESETGLIRTLGNMSGCNELYAEWLKGFRADSIREYKNGWVLDLNKVFALEKGQLTALFELLKPYGFNSDQVKSVYESCRNKTSVGQRFISSEYEVVIGREKLEIIPIGSIIDSVVEFSLSELVNGEVDNVALHAEIKQKKVGETRVEGVDGKRIIALSEKALESDMRMQLRPWKSGDRLRPFGMKGSKLVSDLFVDAKYSELDKLNTKVLAIGDEVLWVLGLRSSKLYNVDESDEKYVTIEM